MRILLPVLMLLLTACGAEPPAEEASTAASGESSTVASEAAMTESAEPARLVVYTSRQPHLIEPLFDRYTEQTGIDIDYINDNEAALIERLDAEGSGTVADIFMTVDAGNLWHAAERGLLQPIESESLQAAVPEALRDDQGRWFGLSVRARTIVYHPERVDPDALSTYEALAEEAWDDRLCLRTSQKVYNQSLVAMLIEHHGEDRTEEIVRGWVDNLATNPFSSDTRLIEAIEAGQCDVGIVNSYYLGRKLAENPDYPVTLFWANQDTTGTHVNVSGAGVTRHAPRAEAAQALLEWLASPDAQAEFAQNNLEFPVNPDVTPRGIVEEWGDFRADDTPLQIAGERQAEAVRLMDRAGYR
ncbi:extracellular solute-binding protein [Wenzhouxiangella sp. XN201]|uniref:extracellular solute-binding protein n=1 Tax=Wenzhouxiangella sp. XN201 TaxID=2710755 RepID=UPI0013DC396A|nr:extracellular solute-binding protein [Wenzhouxiangella sp. XN201]